MKRNDLARPSCIVVGNGTLTLECCRILHDRGYEIRGVVTDLGNLKDWAVNHGVPLAAATGGSGEGWAIGRADYLFSIVNLTILEDSALGLASTAAINFHDGPLPGYAGLNTPAWAILRGEAEHAITWHVMYPSVDAGPVILTRQIALENGETSVSLNTKCFEAGLNSFGELLDHLEEGALEEAKLPVGERRLFRGETRPDGGGVIDPARPTAELAALARGLDFGHYRNPLGRPHLTSHQATVVVDKINPITATGDGTQGQILAAGPEGIHMRVADGAVLLSGLSALDSEPLEPEDALARLGLELGAVYRAPSQGFLDGYQRAAAAWARHETAWTERLRGSSLVQAPYLFGGSTAGVDRSQSLNQVHGIAELTGPSEVAGDVLLALVSLLSARLAPTDSGVLAFRHPQLAALPGEAVTLFTTHVPLPVEVPLGTGFLQWKREFLTELRATTRLGGFTRDLLLRDPDLKNIEPVWGQQQWPLTIGRVASLEDVGPAEPRTGALSIYVADDGAACLWSYNPATVSSTVVASLQQRLQALIDDIRRGRTVHEASVLAPADAADLGRWNDTAEEVPGPQTAHASFEAQVGRTPHRTAVTAGQVSLTYLELNAASNRLARLIRQKGAHPGSKVGILMNRGVDMVAALLAVLKAGCAYVPLDPAFPPDRIAYMAADSDLALVIAHEAHAERAYLPQERVLFIERQTQALSELAPSDLGLEVAPDELAYVIYTSGSTGRPKGVMLEHRNVTNFMAGMDQRLQPGAEPGKWLAVTSISFDISVLELFWTLSRGFEVVLYSGDDLAPTSAVSSPSAATVGAKRNIDLSLFYFSSDAGEEPQSKYRLLLEGARFADENGFLAVWTPERHFHDFGGLYPNPAVTGAAIAAVTERVRIRAGSCVLPLHHPIRVAEEWAVVDNLSGGRVDVSFASGWQPNDFVLAPDNHAERNAVMYEGIETVKALWRGEPRTFEGPGGRQVEVSTLPRPVQPELPIWVTAAGNPATFRAAGEAGAGILTHLLGQDLTQLKEKVTVYREAWAAAGHAGRGHVSLMLHTFVGEDEATVREQARGPLREYLRTAAELTKQFASSFPAFKGTDTTDREELDARFRSLSNEDMEALLEHAVDRYYESNGLFGTVDQARRMVRNVSAADVDEIACLIDFGIGTDEVLAGLRHLARLHRVVNLPSALSIPELLHQHQVTHLQCTPSMAQMLVADELSRDALRRLDYMLVGGEALPTDLARTLVETVSGNVLNMYGPTETTIWSTVEAVTQERLADAGLNVPIGQPIANTTLHIFDERMQPLPPGVPGELVIGGRGVGRGYWRNPAATADKFLNDSGMDERLYRTGDLACYRPDGSLDFLGRLDFQVKVRGHRIELGEIEIALREHKAVREAVVDARGSGSATRLVAYLVPQEGVAVEERDLRAFLEARLPSIMVPTAFVVMAEFPLTPNKKLDRRALPEPRLEEPDRQADFQPVEAQLEQELAVVWQRVLSVEQVGRHDDFFELGGNSLLAVFAVSEAVKRGIPVSLGQLLNSPTVAGLASQLGTAHVAQGPAGIGPNAS